MKGRVIHNRQDFAMLGRFDARCDRIAPLRDFGSCTYHNGAFSLDSRVVLGARAAPSCTSVDVSAIVVVGALCDDFVVHEMRKGLPNSETPGRPGHVPHQ